MRYSEGDTHCSKIKGMKQKRKHEAQTAMMCLCEFRMHPIMRNPARCAFLLKQTTIKNIYILVCGNRGKANKALMHHEVM